MGISLRKVTVCWSRGGAKDQVWVDQRLENYDIKLLEKQYVKKSESLVKTKIDISKSYLAFTLTYS